MIFTNACGDAPIEGGCRCPTESAPSGPCQNNQTVALGCVPTGGGGGQPFAPQNHDIVSKLTINNNRNKYLDENDNSNITIIEDKNNKSLIITEKPKTEELKIINHNNRNNMITIKKEKNDEYVNFTPINLGLKDDINFDITKPVDIQIDVPKEETNIGDNIRKLEEIKKKLSFDQIPKEEKINSPLSE